MRKYDNPEPSPPKFCKAKLRRASNKSKEGLVQHLVFARQKLGAGLTLVEALVAISILLIAVVGPLSMVAQSIQTANIGKDQITAFYLAQEAVEYIRNKRDSNILNNMNWLNELADCMSGATCRIDAVNNSIANCSGDVGGICKVFNKLKDTNNLTTYRYDTPPDYVVTTFRRTVSVSEPIVNQEAVITVTMNWQTGIVLRSFVITERIFNWSGP